MGTDNTLGTLGMSDGCHANTSTFARRKAMSALSYLLSRVALMVKVPSVPSSLTGTFLVVGELALDFLPAEHSGKSLIGAQHSEEVCFPESLLEVLLDFLLSFFLAGASILAASAATASLYILSTQMTASFLS